MRCVGGFVAYKGVGLFGFGQFHSKCLPPPPPRVRVFKPATKGD